LTIKKKAPGNNKKAIKKTTSKKAAAKKAAVKKATVKKAAVKKAAVKKAAVKKAAVKKTAVKKAAVKKTAVKKAAVKKAVVKKAAVKKAVVKKAAVKKAAVKKAAVKKAAVKKAVVKKAELSRSVIERKKEITKTLRKAIAKSKAGIKSNGKDLKSDLFKHSGNQNTEKAQIKQKKYKPNSKVKYNTSELRHFRNIILHERKAIIESAKANMDALVDKDSGEYKGDNLTYSSHMAEQGTDEMEREKNYLFVQRDEKYLGYLQDALMRIDQGTYGICVDCMSEPKNLCRTCPLIDKERLELVPITQHCIECKNMRG